MEIHGNPYRITRSTLQNLICYRTSVSRASGTPCGSVFGRFCVSRCRIGVTLGSIFMEIMEDNGRKVKNGPPKRHIDVEWHMQCISYRLVSDPDGPISSIYSFFQLILGGQEGHEPAEKNNVGVSRGVWEVWTTTIYSSPCRKGIRRHPSSPGGRLRRILHAGGFTPI